MQEWTALPERGKAVLAFRITGTSEARFRELRAELLRFYPEPVETDSHFGFFAEEGWARVTFEVGGHNAQSLQRLANEAYIQLYSEQVRVDSPESFEVYVLRGNGSGYAAQAHALTPPIER